uniref:Uncharacterized protein n=1 Tax=viral metagenome TaxID=1070528 RepID=A0A2V0R9J1_9ZZZZ
MSSLIVLCKAAFLKRLANAVLKNTFEPQLSVSLLTKRLTIACSNPAISVSCALVEGSSPLKGADSAWITARGLRLRAANAYPICNASSTALYPRSADYGQPGPDTSGQGQIIAGSLGLVDSTQVARPLGATATVMLPPFPFAYVFAFSTNPPRMRTPAFGLTVLTDSALADPAGSSISLVLESVALASDGTVTPVIAPEPPLAALLDVTPCMPSHDITLRSGRRRTDTPGPDPGYVISPLAQVYRLNEVVNHVSGFAQSGLYDVPSTMTPTQIWSSTTPPADGWAGLNMLKLAYSVVGVLASGFDPSFPGLVIILGPQTLPLTSALLSRLGFENLATICLDVGLVHTCIHGFNPGGAVLGTDAIPTANVPDAATEFLNLPSDVNDYSAITYDGTSPPIEVGGIPSTSPLLRDSSGNFVSAIVNPGDPYWINFGFPIMNVMPAGSSVAYFLANTKEF